MTLLALGNPQQQQRLDLEHGRQQMQRVSISVGQMAPWPGQITGVAAGTANTADGVGRRTIESSTKPGIGTVSTMVGHAKRRHQ